MKDDVAVITVVLSGSKLDQANLPYMAERIHKALSGDELEGLDRESPENEGRTCDGINIMDKICIGKSSSN